MPLPFFLCGSMEGTKWAVEGIRNAVILVARKFGVGASQDVCRVGARTLVLHARKTQIRCWLGRPFVEGVDSCGLVE